MSFSSRVKNELCRTEIHHSCCLNAELAAVIAINGTVRIQENDEVDIRIITENAAFARKIFSLIKKVYHIYPQVVIRRNRKLKKHIAYILNILSSTGSVKILEGIGIRVFTAGDDGNVGRIPQNIMKKACCRRAYLRGAFLSGGSISDPEKTYHMEIMCHSESLAAEIKKMMDGFHLHAKVIGRKGNHVLYLKEGENIVDMLNIIGAHSALMELENVRILKGMRNSVNRIVNCETANLQKTVDASIRQIENIEYIRDYSGLGNLPDNLREIAELRLEYRDSNLKELGEMLSPVLGKSGVNHRLRKLDKIAERARSLKGGA